MIGAKQSATRLRDAGFALTCTAASYASYYAVAATMHILGHTGTLTQFLPEWDSGWYMSIIQHGYTFHAHANGQAQWAFFPLYPLTVRIFQTFTGLGTPTAGVLLSNIYLALTAYFTLRYLSRTRSRTTAQLAVLLLTFGPYSFYFSSIYTEPLYILLIIAGLYALEGNHWLTAGLLTAALSATRTTGILFGIILLERLLRSYHAQDIPLKKMPLKLTTEPSHLLSIMVAPLGLTAYSR